MMKTTLSILVLASLTMAAAQAHAVEAVVHGDFETRDQWIWATNYSGMIDRWNAPGTSGSSLYLGYGGTAGSYAMQTVDLSSFASATLSFDLTTVARSTPDASYVSVTLGYDNEVYRHWFTEAPVGQVQTQRLTISLANPAAFRPNSPLIFGSGHGNRSATDIWVDNVSILAEPVPEPATLGVLGFGVAAALRRRRK